MSLTAKIRRAPLRLATGAFILNSGLTKLKAGDATAEQVHGMAANAYPAVEKVPPKPFVKVLAVGEVALGGALLAPVVPAGLAGLGLMGFSGALLGLYWRTPGLHEPDSPRPTAAGTAVAKDVFMLGIGTSLVIDAALTESRALGIENRARARAMVKAETKSARKQAKRAAKRARKRTDSLLPDSLALG